jgi:hypothetical protein
MSPLRRSATALACGILAHLGSCGGGAGGPVDGERALANARKICEFGPRPAGGRNLTAVATWLQSEIRKLGLEPNSDVWEEKVGLPGRDTVKFQNVWTEIAGADPAKGPILVLGAHYDTKLCEGHPEPERNFPFVGAIDSAGSCGLLLELARILKDRKSPLNVWCVWFDGEESITWDWNEGATALIGSKRFVKRMAEDKARFPSGVPARCKAMVLMDLIGDAEQKIDKDKQSHSSLLKIFGDAAARMGESDRMYRYETSLKGGDDHVPFMNYGVPAIDLIDFTWRNPLEHRPGAPREVEKYFPWWHTKDDTPDRLSAKSLAFVGNLIWNAWPDLETFCGVR